ncbi:MAG: phosphoglucomutase/phosphomannomutase family protein [Dehalococcoidia bacterium]|nr:phosphoglucomutase/phosphomannomutase family protein [Dehalococcoidia bacterium]
MPIKFGTDGWRAIIAEDFTFENVRICAQGTADLINAGNQPERGIVIGYDTRFLSEEFARAVAEVMTANGIPTMLCDRPAPTPTVSYDLVSRDAGAGAIITASHNPANYNGFKYKPDYGGSASPEIVEQLESRIAAVEQHGVVNRMPLHEAERQGLLEIFDPEPEYLAHLATIVDVQAIRNAGLNVVVDSMYGSGAGYLKKLLEGGTTRVVEIHGERNPAFPGMAQPEPIAHNLTELIEAVQDHNADVGIALDGDADRLGMVDESGNFVTTLQTFALLCYHLLENLGQRGPLVRSITMTSMIDRLAELYDVPIFDTPVGFKFLGPVLMAEEAIAAGEESGGYAFRGNVPERDGILSGLLILDMIVKTQMEPSDLLYELVEKVGPHFYDRWDVSFDPSQRDAIEQSVRVSFPSTLAGKTVVQVDERDGIRFVLESGHWSLIRFSGTEPLLRIYAEGESPAEVAALLGEARAMTGV